MRKVLSVLAVLLTFAGAVQAETRVYDLGTMINAGKISAQDVVGNGSSSGDSLEGYLVNKTSKEMNLDISLAAPIYFRNSGVGQNMIALQVYGADGSYQQLGRRSFITLRPRARMPVKFVAYCADYEKDNPSSGETFTGDTLPPELRKVTANINKFSRSNQNTDITKPAQVAIWLAQGISPDDIRKKFPFSPADERLARSFMK